MSKRSSMWTRAAAAILTASLCGAAPRALAATDTEKCQAAKVKAAGKKVFDKAKCHQKALLNSLPVDPLCIQKVEEKFTRAIAKADTLGACNGTASGIEATVDSCIADLVDDVASTPPCTGTQVGGFCWYQGALGADCNATCAAAGRVYDPATASYAGSGGIGANCAAVFAAFGWGFDSSISGGGGVGCASLLGFPPYNFRDTDPTTASAATPNVFRFCACQ